jgi:hypothetical protein
MDIGRGRQQDMAALIVAGSLAQIVQQSFGLDGVISVEGDAG